MDKDFERVDSNRAAGAQRSIILRLYSHESHTRLPPCGHVVYGYTIHPISFPTIRKIWYCISLIIFVSIFKLQCLATDFTAKGKLSWSEDTNIHQIQRYLFTVKVSSNNWNIITEKYQKNIAVKVSVGSQGDKIFSVSYIKSAPTANWKPQAGSVRPGPNPFVQESPAGPAIVWVGFVSPQYFERSTNSLAPKVFSADPDIYNSREMTRFAWERLSVGGRCTKTAKFYDNQGRLTHEYITKDSTNGIPIEFNLRTYRYTSKNSEPSLLANIKGTVTNLLFKVREKSFIPALPGATPVREERFVKDDPPVSTFFYTPPAGKWLSDDEVKSLKEYQEQKSVDHGLIASEGLNIQFAVILLILTMTGCLIALVKKRNV